MSGGMSGWLAPLLLVLVLGPVTVHGAVQVSMLVLVPLSGSEGPRGRAQRVGVDLALEETSLERTRAGLDLLVTVNDTQCDSSKESRLVLNELMSHDRHVVVLGGACGHVGGAYHSRDLAWMTYAPQLTFDIHALTPLVGVNHVTLNFRSGIAASLERLVQFVVDEGWHQVALLTQSDYYQTVSAWLFARLHQHRVNVTQQLGLDYQRHLLVSHVRVIIMVGSPEEQDAFLCHQGATPAGRHVWLLPRLLPGSVTNAEQTECYTSMQVVEFRVTSSLYETEEYDIFTTKVKFKDESLLTRGHIEAAYAYDATRALVGALRSASDNNMTIPSDRPAFTQWFTDTVRNNPTMGVTGRPSFQADGSRQVIVDVIRMSDKPLGNDSIPEVVQFSGVPLGALVVLCSLAGLGVIYAAAIITFNLLYRENRLIKMTSPNLNCVSSTGTILAFCSVIVLGLDSGRVSMETQGHLQMAGAWLVSLGWTLMYGAVFARSWRVYLVFRNLNFNGKLTRDEHLLLGVLFLVLGDVTILLPWTLTDPVSCSHSLKAPYYDPSSMSDVTVMVGECWSSLQILWVSLLYAYKLIILLAGTYFIYQTRHVTLPSLRDSREMYEVVYTVAIMATVSLPLLAMNDITYHVKYITGALVILLTASITLSLIYIPKILLIWRESRAGHSDSTRFQFSESLRRTQDSADQCGSSWCCSLGSGDEDRYARDMLTSEIDTLKRTIKEKDTTIRELTDRLYFGPEKVKEVEYMTSPRRMHGLFQDMHRTHVQQVQSQPLVPSSGEYTQPYDIMHDMRIVSRDSPSGSSRASPQGCEGPSQNQVNQTQVCVELSVQNLNKNRDNLHDNYSENMYHRNAIEEPYKYYKSKPSKLPIEKDTVLDTVSMSSDSSQQDSLSEHAQCSEVDSVGDLDVAAIESEAGGMNHSWLRHHDIGQFHSSPRLEPHQRSYNYTSEPHSDSVYTSQLPNISQSVGLRFEPTPLVSGDMYYKLSRGYYEGGHTGSVI